MLEGDARVINPETVGISPKVARFLDFREAVCENADDVIHAYTCSAPTLLTQL